MTFDDKTALVVVDVQNDFADPNGSLYVSEGEEVVAIANQVMIEATGAGAHIIYTQDWHPESTPHFEKDGGVWPVHCVHDTWGSEFHPDLNVVGESVRKGTGGEDGYSGFTVRDPKTGTEKPTELEDRLRALGVERVVVLGLATDYCVKETVIDAVHKGFETVVIGRGIRAVDLELGDGDRAIAEMKAIGARLD